MRWVFFLNQKPDLLAYIQDRSTVYPRTNTEGQTILTHLVKSPLGTCLFLI